MNEIKPTFLYGKKAGFVLRFQTLHVRRLLETKPFLSSSLSIVSLNSVNESYSQKLKELRLHQNQEFLIST